MKVVQRYLVSVLGSKGWRFCEVASRRAAIALTWGLSCRWVVEHLQGTEWATVAVSNPNASVPYHIVHDTRWSHGVRAFRQSLVKACKEVRVCSVQGGLLIKHDYATCATAMESARRERNELAVQAALYGLKLADTPDLSTPTKQAEFRKSVW